MTAEAASTAGPAAAATAAAFGQTFDRTLNQTLEQKCAAAGQLIREQLHGASGDVCLTCSFQAEDVVLLDMIRKITRDSIQDSAGGSTNDSSRNAMLAIPVIFLDTGYHFAETYAYRDRIAREWDLNLVNLLPEQTVAAQEAQFGILNQTDPSRCCHLRKVIPLFRELEKYRVWFTGLRREQAKSRANLQPVDQFQLPTGKRLRKISPLTEWTAKDVWQYAAAHGIALLPLYDLGYTSIGCEPCTSLPIDPNDPRSGRWGGRKQECGIHLQSAE